MQNIKNIFFEIIILLFLVYLFSKHNSEIYWLENKLRTITTKSNFKYSNPKIYDSDKTGVDYDGNIHIIFRDKNKNKYSDETIILVGIHEISHIISQENSHNDNFVLVYDILKDTAIKLKLLDKKSKIDESYPQLN